MGHCLYRSFESVAKRATPRAQKGKPSGASQDRPHAAGASSNVSSQ